MHKDDLPLLPVTPQVEVTGFIFARHFRLVWGLARNVARHLELKWRATFLARHLKYFQRWRVKAEAAKVTGLYFARHRVL